MAVVEREASLLRGRRAGGRPRAGAASPPPLPEPRRADAAPRARGRARAAAARRRRRRGAARPRRRSTRTPAPSSRASAPSSTARAPRSRSTATARGSSAAKLPAPPAGRVYQVWLDRGGKSPEPTSALFSTRRDGSRLRRRPRLARRRPRGDGHRRADRAARRSRRGACILTASPRLKGPQDAPDSVARRSWPRAIAIPIARPASRARTAAGRSARTA